MAFLQIFFAIFLTLTHISGEETVRLKCNLEWKLQSEGNPAPHGVVSTFSKSDLVDRIYVGRGAFNNKTYIGNFYYQSRKAYFALQGDSGGAMLFENFEVLTNPHGCTISWLRNGDEGTRVIVNGLQIARATFDDKYFAGLVSGGTLTVGVDGDTPLKQFSSSEYQFLLSYSNGFHLMIRNFLFTPDLFGGDPDFAGYDEIHNKADTYVTQTLVHTTSIKESHRLVVSKTTTTRETTTVGWEVMGNGKSETTTETYSHTKTTDITTETENVYSISRTIEVPPRTSIVACTVIFVKENFEANYTAVGQFTAKGLNATEIFNHIRAEDASKDIFMQDNQVYVNAMGTFKGAMALSTKFIVSPINATVGCKEILRRQSQKTKTNFEITTNSLGRNPC